MLGPTRPDLPRNTAHHAVSAPGRSAFAGGPGRPRRIQRLLGTLGVRPAERRPLPLHDGLPDHPGGVIEEPHIAVRVVALLDEVIPCATPGLEPSRLQPITTGIDHPRDAGPVRWSCQPHLKHAHTMARVAPR